MYAHVSCYFRCTLHTLSLSGSGTDDVVHAQKELSSLRGGVDHRALELVALDNAELAHVGNSATRGHQVESRAAHAVVDGLAQAGNKVGRVETGVVSQDGGELAEGLGEGIDGKCLLASHVLGGLVDGLGHVHLSAATAESSTRVGDSLREDGKSVVERALSLVEKLLGGATEDDCASPSCSDTGEANEAVLANDNLLDDIAVAELDVFGVVESAGDLGASDKCEALHTVEVGVLDRCNASVREKLLGPVVDELSVDETIDAVALDALDLGLHLLALRLLQLGQLAGSLNLYSRAEDLHLVCVHASVCNHDLGVLHALGLVDTKLFVQNEARVEV
jgi:hypothetical protein